MLVVSTIKGWKAEVGDNTGAKGSRMLLKWHIRNLYVNVEIEWKIGLCTTQHNCTKNRVSFSTSLNYKIDKFKPFFCQHD